MGLIIVYICVMITIFFWGGYGLSSLLLRRRMDDPIKIWLVPWMGIVFYSVSLTILSLLGLSGATSLVLSLLFISSLNLYVIIKNKKLYITLFFPEDYVLGIIFIASIVFNLLIFYYKYRFPTTISLGNNDVIAYASSADYLVKNSILHSFNDKSIQLGESTLLLGPYRWGVVNLISMFGSIFGVGAYEFIYLLEVVVYSLMLPLLYELFRQIYKRSFLSLLLVSDVITFNTNLLYILYHDFFGQVLFWGLSLFLYILLYPYLISPNMATIKLIKNDYIIGLVFASIFLSYHEPVVFVLMPLALYWLILLFANRASAFNTFVKLCKIALITFVLAPTSVLHNIFFDFWARFAIDKSLPLGWPPFRQTIPYANPFEILGFSSIHSYPPLPTILAIMLSLMVVCIIGVGIVSSKYRLILFSLFPIYVFFLVLSSFFEHNYFDYNRIITYVLPLIGVIFAGGIMRLSDLLIDNLKSHGHIVAAKIAILAVYLLAILIFLLQIFWARKLFFRLITENYVVDQAMISLSMLRKQDINEAIYTEDMIRPVVYWKTIWEDYFLFQGDSKLQRGPVIPNILDSYKLSIPDGALLLVAKSTPWVKNAEYLLSEVVWENSFYRLGRVCNAQDCLMNSIEDLSQLNVGVSKYEDSLFLSGWSTPDVGGRWADNKVSHIRLITKVPGYNKLVIEAQSLSEPQEVTVTVDGVKLPARSIVRDWKVYTFILPRQLQVGVHRIEIESANLYSPSEVLGNLDQRKLSIRVKRVGLTK